MYISLVSKNEYEDEISDKEYPGEKLGDKHKDKMEKLRLAMLRDQITPTIMMVKTSEDCQAWNRT